MVPRLACKGWDVADGHPSQQVLQSQDLVAPQPHEGTNMALQSSARLAPSQQCLQTASCLHCWALHASAVSKSGCQTALPLPAHSLVGVCRDTAMRAY